LGYFRNEKQYCDYFEKLLQGRGIKYVREYRFTDNQYGQEIVRCICDFIVEDKIIIEFKAKDFITKEDYYQVQRYLATLNMELGIIANFRQRKVYPKRVLNSAFREK
jgi:GxxExxY protein